MANEFLVKEVHRSSGKVKKVIIELKGKKIVFEKNKRNKILRTDTNGWIPGETWTTILRQVQAIFAGKEKAEKTKDIDSRDDDWFETLEKNGILFRELGRLGIARWNKGQKIYQSTSDLPAAIRMQDHILEKYGINPALIFSEKNEIENFSDILKKINRFLSNWKKNKDKREEIEKELAILILHLGRCRNDLKINARSQMVKIAGLEDSLGRENSGAMAARSIAALNKLSERINQIKRITVKTAFRRELLMAEMRREREIIKSVIPEINLLLNFRALKSGFKPHEVPIFLNIAEKTAKKLDTKLAEPFLSTAKKIKTALKSLSKTDDLVYTSEALSLIKSFCEKEL